MGSSQTFPPFWEGLFNRFVSEAIDKDGICAEAASHKNGASPSGSLKSKCAQALITSNKLFSKLQVFLNLYLRDSEDYGLC